MVTRHLPVLRGAMALLALLSGPGPALGGTVCDRLSELEELAFYPGETTDPVYLAIRAAGLAGRACLIDAISDTTPMKDPRSVPSVPVFRVGDLAVVLLSDVTEFSMPDALPKDLDYTWEKMGYFAYFAYVDDLENRLEYQRKVRAFFEAMDRRAVQSVPAVKGGESQKAEATPTPDPASKAPSRIKILD